MLWYFYFYVLYDSNVLPTYFFKFAKGFRYLQGVLKKKNDFKLLEPFEIKVSFKNERLKSQFCKCFKSILKSFLTPFLRFLRYFHVCKSFDPNFLLSSCVWHAFSFFMLLEPFEKVLRARSGRLTKAILTRRGIKIDH